MEKKEENQEKKPYSFMKEVIKKKPLDKKCLLLKGVKVAAAGVAIGIIAAFVFVQMVPVAENILEPSEGAKRVSIPADEDSDEQTAEVTPEVTVEPTPVVTPQPDPSISLDDYKKVYKEMLTVAERTQHALVTVIGITSQMDYFNQNYENQQQISGLVVADNGQDLFILTEYRGVENVEKIQVTFYDGARVDAAFQRQDANTGLAILRVALADVSTATKKELEIAPLGSSYTVTQGEPILALGSPIGYSNSVAYGVITSVSNKVSTLDTEYNLLTTDILGSKDGSGVLVNLDGEIVGIIAQNYSSQDKNIITGLAISQIKELIERLSNNESQAYIGIKGLDVTAQIEASTGIPTGLLVTAVQADSPAMYSGIKEYDVIVKVGEEKIGTLRQYHESLLKLTPGQTVTITAMRKGAEGYAEVLFNVAVGEI